MKYKVTKHSKKMKQELEKIVKGFDWNRVSWYDKEYLAAMVNDTINSRSYKAKGIPFEQKYPDAGDYALFNDENSCKRYLGEFYHSDSIASHLLNKHPKGRKYWLAWSYTPKNQDI